jgi:hypothetical protein
MRKRLITPSPQDAAAHHEGWLDLDRAAVVEVTSEEKDYPVESALVAGEMRGWRAADSGTQTIRLIFDEPQRLTRIALVFEETETAAYPRVRLAMVSGWRTLVSRDCAPAVEFQSPQHKSRGRGVSG